MIDHPASLCQAHVAGHDFAFAEVSLPPIFSHIFYTLPASAVGSISIFSNQPASVPFKYLAHSRLVIPEAVLSGIQHLTG
jgi:hypothetical protein